ncbi:MAG TPA: efflux RND transporter permease subunit [Kofleriaceae bacterium]|nr:efflux RND transporter permease subunit [Kofleriaceae bacterium]
MTGRVVAWCSRHPGIVLALALALGIGGELARRSLSRDVIPDLSDPQIVLIADWMGHPAPQVAAEVTQVLTRALDGVPGATAVRGSTMSGMAYIDILFGSADDLAAARQDIAQRIARATLPPNVRLQIGPLASSTGWVFQYALIDPLRKKSLLELRRFQDETLRPALAAIPGVAEVASIGGHTQQVRIEAKPYELRARSVAFSDIVGALRQALAAPHPPTLAQLQALPLAPTGALLRDVARVRLDDDMPVGVADLDGGTPAIGGIVIARRDANLPALIGEVRRILAREHAQLPPAIKLVTVYDRLDVADRVEDNLVSALAEEVAVVVLILLVFLLHGPSALVPLATLPLVVLATFGAMWLLGVPATIMSLGGIGIALGMAVDADIVALEACHRRLETAGARPPPTDRLHRIIGAASSFAPAILTSLLITALSFLPVFAFTGETGRLLRPLALTKTLVIAASAVVTLTVAPALRARLLGGRIRPELANPLTRTLVKMYRPFVHFALRRPVLTLVTAGLAVLSCLPIAARLGGEFLPRVDEGDVLYMPTTLPGVPPDQAASILRRQDRAINRFPEVDTVFGKVGRADTATDPAPFSMTETTIRLVPRSAWPTRTRVRWYSEWAPGPLRRLLGTIWPEETTQTTAELVARMDRATRLPGWTNAWTAPARGRIDMMSTGVRTPVGIRVIAADPTRLEALGAAVRTAALAVPGTRSAVFESLGGEASLAFTAEPAALARTGVDPALVRTTADLLVTGGQIGELVLDGRRMRVRVAPDFSERGDADMLRGATVRAPDAGPVPLALLGQPSYVTRPATIRTDRGELCAYIYVDLEDGTDLAGYVERARRAITPSTLALGPGERIEWTGQYELIAAGQSRLRWIVPLVALSMLGLLLLQFRNLTEALIVLAAVPFALVGSVWTLYALGYPMSAPVWVGLLSVVGLAMQTGVVMVVYIDEAFHRRVRERRLTSRDDIVAAHAEGTVRRLRPKLMTITTMALALVPLLWADGAGAEIMRRVAAPMLGGLLTSAFLTLEVLPVLYTIWRYRQLRRAQRLGVPIEDVVGPAPSWARD